jgi:hypothetical protein
MNIKNAVLEYGSLETPTLVGRTVPVRRSSGRQARASVGPPQTVPVREDCRVKPWIVRVIQTSQLLGTLPRTLLSVGVRNSGRARVCEPESFRGKHFAYFALFRPFSRLKTLGKIVRNCVLKHFTHFSPVITGFYAIFHTISHFSFHALSRDQFCA